MTSQIYTGLTQQQVAERVARGESNAFEARVDRTYWQIFKDNVFNIFNFVIVLLVVILFSFGSYDVIVFATFSVILNSVVGMVQEIRAKRALDRLAALAARQVRVYRDGQITSLPIGQIVKDDVLPLEPGERVVVDGRVLESDGLELDESLLTGESDAVIKEVDSSVSSGSFCIAGTGVMVATAVGAESTVNKLARTAKAYKNPRTPTQRKVDVFVEMALIGMVLIAPMLFVDNYYVDRIGLHETAKNLLVVVTSFVPQGLVLSATLSLTLGAVSISRHKTLIQRINAVESLAHATVLCFDKTGTLTRNELAVVEILPVNGTSHEEILHLLASYTTNLAHQNKTALAISQYVDSTHTDLPKKVQEISFTSARKWGAIVLPDYTLILGAPERVLDPDRHVEALRCAREQSAQGQRVLALARSQEPPQGNRVEVARQGIALVLMSDQVREDIRETLESFRQQSVDLKVISGDNVETVRAIAQQSGLPITEAYTGEQLEAMQPDAFAAAVCSATVFARIEPETKRKIVAALRKQGAYVAMVGDGVNDVPALKEADLAIVMNEGTQISKDVADIVLLNNAMSTLPRAFAEGREITQKIYGTTKLFLTKNIYHILLFLLIGFMSLPFPITPIQISWMVFCAVNVPTLLLTFGLIRPAPMQHFGREVFTYVLVSGCIGALSMAGVYAFLYLTSGRRDGSVDGMARMALMLYMTFYGIVVFWNTFGIDFYHPQTIRRHWIVFALGLIFGALCIAGPLIVPQTFAYVPVPLVVFVFLIAVLITSIVVLRLAVQRQRLLRGLRSLAEP